MTDILRISIPLTVWIAAFSAIYGLEGLVCSDNWAEAGLSPAQGHAALIAAWVIAIVVQAGLLLALRVPRFASSSGFIQAVGVSLAAFALVATVWTLFPVVTTSVCI